MVISVFVTDGTARILQQKSDDYSLKRGVQFDQLGDFIGYLLTDIARHSQTKKDQATVADVVSSFKNATVEQKQKFLEAADAILNKSLGAVPDDRGAGVGEVQVSPKS